MRNLSSVEILIIVFGIGVIGFYAFTKIVDLKEDIKNKLNPF